MPAKHTEALARVQPRYIAIMSSQSHAVLTSPVRYTIQITTNELLRQKVQVRPSILVIDADQVFLQLIHHALADEYQVLIAHDLAEAAKVIRRGRFDLLLMDLSTPLCDGVELLQRIRRHPRLGEIPLLALCTSAGLRRHLLDMDTVGIVPKVRWLEDLTQTISQTLRLSDELSIEDKVPMVVQPKSARRESVRVSQKVTL